MAATASQHSPADTRIIPPGATLGVLGGGQLGRMFALAARRMGYRVHTLAPGDDTPTGQVADLEVRAAYDDLDAVGRFARGVAAVTFEFENVPAATTEAAARHAPIRPGGHVLHTSQNRLREKTFLADAGLPVTPFEAVQSPEGLAEAIERLGAPAVLKTAAWGYDGKGQVVIRQPEEAAQAWEALDTDEAILEAFIDFNQELSVVGVRGIDGSFAHFGPIANIHRHHILDLSVAPADVPAGVAEEAGRITRTVLDQLDVVGVTCVEFFLKPDGDLLINEIAPRPHNSGHLTIDAHVTNQFEQQVRAVCGLPLGGTAPLRPAAMVNLLGDLWLNEGQAAEGGGRNPAPDWAAALASPDVKLHLYGKAQPRPGRKMGHLTAVADTTDTAAAVVVSARHRLRHRATE